MLILTLRTDNPQAEIGLYDDHKKLIYHEWQAHRQLAETIHLQILELLKSQGKDWPDIQGVVCYKGPGSFTGLRIGLSVANALAQSLNVPIVGQGGDDWLQKGLARLAGGKNDMQVLPEYGAEAHVTKPRK